MFDQQETTINWWRRLSPCVWAIAALIVGIISSLATLNSSGGWSFLGVIYGLPAVVILLALTCMLKQIFRTSTMGLWIAESFVVLGLLLAFWP